MKDPYKILNLPHSASADDIKRSYRKLARQYHPDRVIDASEKENATASFAEIATAYTLLMDPKRKAQYDHIYKYGGFDNDENADGNGIKSQRNSFAQPTPQSRAFDSNVNGSRKRKSATGVGYVCTDPLSFLWSQGKVHFRQTVAGIQIPSRLQHGNDGLRFAFSAGHVSSSPAGTKQYTCSTTHFSQGKKYTKTETTTYYPDGRKEVLIEGNDFVEQRFYTNCPAPGRVAAAGAARDEGVTQHDERSPWYVSAWSEIKDKLAMCYNPSTVKTDRQ